MGQIADKWSILILSVICAQPSRFNAIKRRLDGITHKALTDELRRLERNGLVARRVIPASPVGVEYSITPLGNTLRDPFDALCAWVVEHSEAVLQAQAGYDRAKEVTTTACNNDPPDVQALGGEAEGGIVRPI